MELKRPGAADDYVPTSDFKAVRSLPPAILRRATLTEEVFGLAIDQLQCRGITATNMMFCRVGQRLGGRMKSGKLRYGLALPAALIAGMMVSSPGHSQYMINMSLVTCVQYVAMPLDQSRIFSAWMSGWFNQKAGYTYINLQAYERNVANVKAWCAANPNELVMTGLHRAMGR